MFFPAGGQCGALGQLDNALSMSQTYQTYVCRKTFFAGEFISTQFYAQTWGSLAAGDNVAFELWRGSGNYNNKMESLVWNFSNAAPSPAPGQWSNVSWDPQVDWAQIPDCQTRFVPRWKFLLNRSSVQFRQQWCFRRNAC